MLREKTEGVVSSKAMIVSISGGYVVGLVLHRERLEQADCFTYIGADVHNTGTVKGETYHRVRERERQEGH